MLTPDFGGDRLRLAVGLPPCSSGCSQKGGENFFWLCVSEVLWNQFHFRLAFGFMGTERQIGANRRNALPSKAPGPGKRHEASSQMGALPKKNSNLPLVPIGI